MTDQERAHAQAKHMAKTTIYRLESVRDELACAIEALQAVVAEDGNSPRGLDVAKVHTHLIAAAAHDIEDEVAIATYNSQAAARKAGR